MAVLSARPAGTLAVTGLHAVQLVFISAVEVVLVETFTAAV